jgi:hypothetical protein
MSYGHQAGCDEETSGMKRWTVTIAASAAALALLGAGMVAAKDHTGDGSGDHGWGHGRGPKDGHPHGGPHGRGPKDGHPHGGPKKGGGGGPNCEAAASTIGAFVDAACPCAGASDGTGGTIPWKNHGQYVRCVAHAVKDAARDAGVKKRCGKGLVRCAARSSCGKDDRVACVVPVAGTCVDGTCAEDPAVACLVDGDCDVSECSVRRTDACTAAGGVGSPGSCCTASPGGAFVD